MIDIMHDSVVGKDIFTDEGTDVEDCHDIPSDNGDSSYRAGETDQSSEETDKGMNANYTNEEQVDVFKIDSVVDMEEIDFSNLIANEAHFYHFSTQHVAFEFYGKEFNWQSETKLMLRHDFALVITSTMVEYWSKIDTMTILKIDD
ncbi:hypothetical protein SESBI_12942 [Sesbania bispinosa]|nr:hypothetical protein SESBI_12942 [Sesbania bispinosa]